GERRSRWSPRTRSTSMTSLLGWRIDTVVGDGHRSSSWPRGLPRSGAPSRWPSPREIAGGIRSSEVSGTSLPPSSRLVPVSTPGQLFSDTSSVVVRPRRSTACSPHGSVWRLSMPWPTALSDRWWRCRPTGSPGSRCPMPSGTSKRWPVTCCAPEPCSIRYRPPSTNRQRHRAECSGGVQRVQVVVGGDDVAVAVVSGGIDRLSVDLESHLDVFGVLQHGEGDLRVGDAV